MEHSTSMPDVAMPTELYQMIWRQLEARIHELELSIKTPNINDPVVASRYVAHATRLRDEARSAINGLAKYSHDMQKLADDLRTRIR